MRLVRDDNDLSMCNELCKSVYGFSRELELRQAIDQGVATMIERDSVITGYAAGIGIFGHPGISLYHVDTQSIYRFHEMYEYHPLQENVAARHCEYRYTIRTRSKIKHYETTTNKAKIRMEDACILLGCL